jgi:oligopeptide/dipeptide ABC transporter ATP-binding protein
VKPTMTDDDAPRPHEPVPAVAAAPAELALSARGLRKAFVLRRSLVGTPTERVQAVDGVNLEVAAGKTLGIVGESGSGKSTAARLAALLIEPDEGQVVVDGIDVTRARRRELKTLRSTLQMIFQDPYSALDPTKTIAHAITEPLIVHRRMRRSQMVSTAEELLARVSLDPALARRRPEELSGGQRQRVCVARALALEPRVLIADEPTSALDLSTRAGILNLLLGLQAETGQAMVLVSHDFATVQHLADHVAVMYLGRVVEEGPAGEIVDDPRHPYTQALISAVPLADPVRQRSKQRIVLHGDAPNPANPPSGCHFRTRCPMAVAECAVIDPPLVQMPDGRKVACIRVAPPSSSPVPGEESF